MAYDHYKESDSLPSLPDFLLWLPENNTPRPLKSERWAWNKEEGVEFEALLAKNLESSNRTEERKEPLWEDESKWWTNGDQGSMTKGMAISKPKSPLIGDSDYSEGFTRRHYSPGLWPPPAGLGIWNYKQEKPIEDWTTTLMQHRPMTRTRNVPQIMGFSSIKGREQPRIEYESLKPPPNFEPSQWKNPHPGPPAYTDPPVPEEWTAADTKLAFSQPGRKQLGATCSLAGRSAFSKPE
jgi:hypothetical protein